MCSKAQIRIKTLSHRKNGALKAPFFIIGDDALKIQYLLT